MGGNTGIFSSGAAVLACSPRRQVCWNAACSFQVEIWNLYDGNRARLGKKKNNNKKNQEVTKMYELRQRVFVECHGGQPSIHAADYSDFLSLFVFCKATCSSDRRGKTRPLEFAARVLALGRKKKLLPDKKNFSRLKKFGLVIVNALREGNFSCPSILCFSCSLKMFFFFSITTVFILLINVRSQICL